MTQNPFSLLRGRGFTLAALAGALTLSGCATMTPTQQHAATGAAIGAAAGALLGAATNGSRGVGTGAVLGGAVGALGGYVWSRQMQEQKEAMERATVGTGVAVSQTPDNRLKLYIPSDVSFDVGRAQIRPNFARVLDQFASTLNANPVTSVYIVGHTDSTGTDAINNPLSVDRANSARNHLVARGVAAHRFQTEGRGSREPVADNGTAEGRAQNRRVEIFVAQAASPAAR
ncbi:OmpA family protein [Hydrogenophaga sp.]|uniref:OmpA family protein n=1 Tax=Hydrogenophaga sp. TaxID=1904254 RepID=UPI001986DDB6|nr:OmpA family protein [Hydrogenophaga sp.]MBD3892286.1 OmpA family protein [Hydrogenophaga sp.]